MVQPLKPRHPLLVLVWSFAILIVLNIPQMLGALISSLFGPSAVDSLGGRAGGLNFVLARGLGLAVLGIPFAFFMTRPLWRRSFNWMRLRFSLVLAVVGLLLGITLTLIVLGLTTLVAHIQVTAYPSRYTVVEMAKLLLGNFCFMAFVGFVEETVFRGMVVREWAARWGWLAAIAGGGLYFGAVHLGNLSGLTVASLFQILIGATGVTALYTALYIRSHSLWLPIGFHAGWDFSLAALLGVTMSGSDSSYSLYRMTVSGSTLATGGPFGIETSAVAVVLYFVAALATVTLFRFRKPLLNASIDTPDIDQQHPSVLDRSPNLQ